MVRCTRCSTEIDETKNVRCPFCNTPVQTAAKPAASGPPPYPFTPAAAPQQPPVINAPQTSGSAGGFPPPFNAAPPASGNGGYYPPANPAQAQTNPAPLFGSPIPSGTTAPPRQSGYGTPNFNARPVPETKYRNSSGGLKWGAILGSAGLLVLYIAFRIGVRVIAYNATHSGSYGGYGSSSSFSPARGGDNPHQAEMKSPMATATAAINALHHGDWQTFYYLSVFDRNEGKSNTDAAEFSSVLNRLLSTSQNGRDFTQVMNALSNITVNAPQSTGDSCDATISANTSYMGQALKLNGTAHLVSLKGIWYLNLMPENGRTTSTSFGDFVGLGNLRSTGGSLLFPGGGGFFAPAMPHIDMANRGPRFGPNGPNPEMNTPGSMPNDQMTPGNQNYGGQMPQNGMPGNGQMNVPNGPQFGQPVGPRFGPPAGSFAGPRFGPGGNQPMNDNTQGRSPWGGRQEASPSAGQMGGGQPGGGQPGDQPGGGQPGGGQPGGQDNSGSQDRRGGF